MSLENEFMQIQSEIKTDGYPMSIGEIASLYQNNELEIHPAFQRIFRWKDNQKTRFIESILIGIPLPTVFVSQRQDGVWDVVDGLQRLSTIFQFMGILRNEEGGKHEPLVLQETKYLPSLRGKKWDDPYDPDNSFTKAQQLDVKRKKIDIKIMLKGSDEKGSMNCFKD
jgi:hypothetical protein